MKAGVSTACLYPQLLEDSLKDLVERHIINTEIFVNSHCEMQPEFTQLLYSILKRNNAVCTAMHPYTCPMEPMMLFSQYERRVSDMLDYYKSFFEIMNRFGTKIFVFHGNKYQTPVSEELYFERFARLAECAESFGIIAAQENVSRCQSRDLEFLTDMAGYLGDKAHFVLDVKQAVRADEDPLMFVKKLGDKIVHVHISDHGEKGDCLPLGHGKFDIDTFLVQLKKAGFDGSVMIELYRYNFSDADELADNYFYLKEIIQKIDVEAKV
ncbi:MAG: sugar phosphate isomerase/epimerase [Oscillospiraceae bacterium]|nr:sugar phosphate isomerase/epimerase [Oscillospiraceae bacterium]